MSPINLLITGLMQEQAAYLSPRLLMKWVSGGYKTGVLNVRSYICSVHFNNGLMFCLEILAYSEIVLKKRLVSEKMLYFFILHTGFSGIYTMLSMVF